MQTDHTLIEQLKITKREIERRKDYLGFKKSDVLILKSLRTVIAEHIDEIVEDFYKEILPFDEINSVIGDAETLKRLTNYQRNYILNLFDGQYDEDYVHSRLRVGVVHKRIGVEPKFYISAVHKLSKILRNVVVSYNDNNCKTCTESLSSIEKIIMFDLTLAFDTYINSLMDETKRSKEELERYAESLEETVAERTKLLKIQARHDGLTGLLNQRSFYEVLRSELSRAQRRNHPTVLIYFDLDGFKNVNDTEGHKKGDEILIQVSDSIRSSIRENEIGARYGGDEFCIILPEGTVEEANHVSKRLCDAIESATEGSKISVSIGIAISLPENNFDADTLVQKADKAMYEAKKEHGFVIKVAE